ncbi:MAG: RHS repeat-associated core domain-containing protein [Actinobacteria bacterium]|nr:RHS repeat-associated core domain-containing protein [Actinomycetota bacterium]
MEIASEEETKVVEYAYDGLGNRIARTEYEIEEGTMSEKKTTEYVNDISSPISQVLQTMDEKGKTDTFIYGLQRIAKVNDKSKADYYLYDGLGSVTGLTNAKGALTTKYSYNEFGIPSASSKFGQGGERSNTYGYTGEDFDQTTGLLYLRARYYSPEIGRFVSQDPLPGSLIAPRTQNRYAYVLNNPLNYIDPTGLGPKTGAGASKRFSASFVADIVGMLILESAIKGTVTGGGSDLIITPDLDLKSIAISTSNASYEIGTYGRFGATSNGLTSDSGFNITGRGSISGGWFGSYYYVSAERSVSFDQGSLNISYTASLTLYMNSWTPLYAAEGAILVGAGAAAVAPEVKALFVVLKEFVTGVLNPGPWQTPVPAPAPGM